MAFIASSMAYFSPTPFTVGAPNVTITRPSSSPGDLLVVMGLSQNGGAFAITGTWTSGPTAHVQWRVVEESEPTTYACSFATTTSGNVASRVVMASYSATTDSLSTQVSIINALGLSISTPDTGTGSFTPDSMALVIFMQSTQGSTQRALQWSAPSPAITVQRSVSEVYPILLGEQVLPSDGSSIGPWASTATGDAALPGVEHVQAFALVIQPAARGCPPRLVAIAATTTLRVRAHP